MAGRATLPPCLEFFPGAEFKDSRSGSGIEKRTYPGLEGVIYVANRGCSVLSS